MQRLSPTAAVGPAAAPAARLCARRAPARRARCATLPAREAEVRPVVATGAAAASSPPLALQPPPGAYTSAVAAGTGKATLSASKIFVMGILAGVYIGFGSLLMLSCGGNCPGIASANPGLKAILSGLFGLPCGLLLVLINGAELYTGNTALVTAAVLEKRASLGQLLKSWLFSYTGNLVGSFALATAAVYAGLFAVNPAAAAAASAKTSLTFGQAFVRGVLCNWLVCLAIWMATAVTTLPGKALAVLFPISAFISIGLEHSVANMFIIPAGILAGAPVSWEKFFMANLLPVTLGNTFAGVVCVAFAYYTVYGKLDK